MDLFKAFRNEFEEIVRRKAGDGTLPAGLDMSRVTFEPPRDVGHGDVATNAAMVLSKAAGTKPRDLAQLLADELKKNRAVIAVEIAGPGFINLRLSDAFWFDVLKDALRAGKSWGDSDMGRGRKVNVEYVSANPTGPMHIGHARGAVFGDALAALLEKAGFEVVREYYVNDAGAQVDALARSVHLRYREALGHPVGAIPEGLYPGEYLIPVGKVMADRHGPKWADSPESEWLSLFRSAAVDEMMELIRGDLALLGVRHAIFSSERAMVDGGRIDAALDRLSHMGLIYEGVLEPPKGMLPEDWEPHEQTLFRATQYGDDVDRPLKKSDGSWTYFASDIAYHWDKYQRGFADMIDVWGADHGGYVKRMQAAVTAICGADAVLDVKLCQMVNLLKGGQPYRMSKRAGTFVTLRDLVEAVGRDVVRFIMLTRKNDAHLDFDLDRVVEQTRDNPVFYVQYCHARAFSVLRHGAALLPDLHDNGEYLAGARLDRLTDPGELALIRMVAGWPRLVESAAEFHEPHRIAFYLYDLAGAFHALWNKGKDDATLRFLVEGDGELSLARLALVRAVAFVVASGLSVFGVEPLEEMR